MTETTLDRQQVRELSAQWQSWGCAICGQTTAEDADEGWRIELHHIENRSQGGEWAYENIVGLCGDLLPRKCHWNVTTKRVELVRNVLGWAYQWVDLRTGETGLLRRLPRAEAGTTIVLEAEEPMGMRTTPESRFQWLRRTIGRTRRQMILVALELQRAYAAGDYQVLGVDWPTYYGNLGLSRSQVSKMLAVANAFGSRPLDLSEHEQQELSLTRLYLGKRLIDGGADPEDALADVVHHPTEQLVAKLKGDEPADRHPCTCPDCGKELWHSPPVAPAAG